MLWPGMRFSLRSQCKRCSAGRLQKVLIKPSMVRASLKKHQPTFTGIHPNFLQRRREATLDCPPTSFDLSLLANKK